MKVGEEQITSLFVGDMGIKTVAVGGDIVYSRPGSYIYIYLDTTNEKET